jgi:hypothetical protein
MKTNISEDLPARKFSPATSEGGESGPSGATGVGGDIEKKARQLVYDAKYEVRQSMGKDSRMDPAAVTRSVLQRIDKSSSSQPIKMRARKIVMGDGQKREVKEFASQNVAKALFDVFIINGNNHEIDEKYIEELKSGYIKEEIERVGVVAGEKSFKWRVTDKKTGNSYVRWATRAKANELRANPNISSIEMIDRYGSPEPNESEKNKGSQTASTTAGRGIGNKDYDGDGKVESGAKEYRGSVHNAIQRKKGGAQDGKDTSNVREEFIGEGDIDKGDKQIKPMKGKNTCKVYDGKGANNMMGQQLMDHQEFKGEIIAETGYEKFLKKVYSLQEKSVSQNQQQLAGMALAYLRGDMPDASDEVKKMAKMGEKKLRDFAKTKHKGLPEKVKEEMDCGSGDKKKKGEDEDPRSMKTVRDRLRTKFGLMGLKMSYEPEGEMVDERTRYSKETGKNYTTGRPSVEGGDPKVSERNKPPLKYGGSRQEPKERGKKPPKAGEPGSGVQDPAHKVALRRNARTRASEFRMDTKGT